MTASLVRDVSSKWHPEGTDTIKAVMDHEFGHQLDDLLKISGGRYGSMGNQTMAEIQKKAFENNIMETLSGYAKTNNKEFVAEGWAEFLNSPTPRETAQSIGEIIVNTYEEKFR